MRWNKLMVNPPLPIVIGIFNVIPLLRREMPPPPTEEDIIRVNFKVRANYGI
ncbi:MAG TPA: hypothetical protein VJ949_02300 [Cryomorphaceae bacterium]|nr:hypothetical protein [Cryomorphaceae bacterium]